MKAFVATHIGRLPGAGDTTRANEDEIVFPGVSLGAMLGITSSQPTNLLLVVEYEGNETLLGAEILVALKRSSYVTRHGEAKAKQLAFLAARRIVEDAARFEVGTVLAYVEPGRYVLRGKVVEDEWQPAQPEAEQPEPAAEQQSSMF